MKLALAQMDISWENKDKNKEKCLEFLLKAKQSGASLILFPEMCLTGFSMNTALIGEACDTADGTVQWFGEQAKKHNIYIGFGWVEKAAFSEKALNNFYIASPEGQILSRYSKLHPFSYGREADFYTGGNTLTTCRIGDVELSTFICYDLRFPEVFQAASRNAVLITVAANWPKARREHWITLLKARAIENQCYIGGINRVGTGDNIEYAGDSMLIDPLGNIIAEAGDSETLLIGEVTTLEAVKLRDSFRLKKDRRIDLYCSLFKEGRD